MSDAHTNTENVNGSERKKTCCCGLTSSDIVKVLSDAAIPIMIGIFTLVIAIQQQNAAQSNRDEDAAQAAELRQHDLELARHQREEDRKTARLQRQEDKENTRLQRDLDLTMINDQRIQDYELADRKRNQSENERIYEFRAAQENHRDDLFIEEYHQQENVLFKYQDDLATLLIDFHSTSLNDSFDKFLLALQMKTGAALRRLDSKHRTILIDSLFDAGIFDLNMSHEQSIFFGTNFSGVEFGHPMDSHLSTAHLEYKYIRIEAADMTHATFNKATFKHSPIFNYSNLDYTYWSNVIISNIRFEGHMTMYKSIFTNSIIYGTVFGKNTKLDEISFESSVQCIHCKFIRSSLLRARLAHSNFIEAKFSSLSMADSDMRNGSFLASEFEGASLDRVNLSGANLEQCKFITVSMINCSMFGTRLNKANFTNVNLTGCHGLTDQQLLSNVVFYQTILPNGTFIKKKP
ncbi:hypothetical protein I4U23_027153 [Adineta vaga]|nr:hypothetical protein I4U23_027153 [Adineta vaga]